MSTDHYFMIVNGTGGASLHISHVEIEFVSAMNSLTYVLGGKVILEGVNINNQPETMWVSPLVDVFHNISSAAVEIHSCAFTNNKYINANISHSKSLIVYFNNQSNATLPISLNISLCVCHNTTFNLSRLTRGGGIGHFHSRDPHSSFSFFFFFFFGMKI
jgi:hypothetical protein